MFPKAANELCQVAKIDEALAPVSAALPITSRYLKSTTLVVRNRAQIEKLIGTMPVAALSASEQARLQQALDQTNSMISMLSDPASVDAATLTALGDIEQDILVLADRLAKGPQGMRPTADALAQPNWGTSEVEIPLLPMTPRGALFDAVSLEVVPIAERFLKIRNLSPELETAIASTAASLKELKSAEPALPLDEALAKDRKAYIKAVERIFKRIDDATIFPSEVMYGVDRAVGQLFRAVDDAKGGLGFVESLFFPGTGIVKSRTQCTEQGSGRWLPKPTDVVATFGRLANPDLENGGGYKGTTLLWWKWLNIADVVGFLIPDGLVDMLPGSYGTHGPDGDFSPTTKTGFWPLPRVTSIWARYPCLMAISGIRCSASLLPWRLVSFLAYRLASIWGFHASSNPSLIR